MDKGKTIQDLVHQWIHIAERDLLTAKQGLEAETVVTETVSFHCQQAVEKYLKAFLVKHQIEFSKTHSIMMLLNLCSKVDKSFKEDLSEADVLTDYAVEIRYPDEWYEPTIEESKQAYEIAVKVKGFVLDKLKA
ncbi:MAG: HEPN domain-containing protein [Deltaproteobacteria bacterium]|nr:HEPN domain-containing protein [Deltaproteobacteria bacterium]